MNVFMRAWTILLIFFLCITPHFPQELNFQVFGIDDGLVQSQVTSIIEDSNGFIWIGSYGGGLSRFNGKKFQTFDRIDGLTNELVISLYEDQNNILWVGTYFGVYKFNGNRFEHMDPEIGFPRGEVWTIIGGDNGDIFFADKIRGVVQYNNGQIVKNDSLSSLSNKSVVTLFHEKKGPLWIGCREGLLKYQNNSIEKVIINSAPDYWASIIFKDSEGRFWAGSQSGLFLNEKGNWRSLSETDGLPSKFIWTIHESTDGVIRIGTDSGLAVFDGKRFLSYTKKDGLPNNYITAIAEDRSKNIWIGTESGLLKQLAWFPFKKYTTKSGLKSDSVWSFFEKSNGDILVSTDKGVSLISLETGNVQSASTLFSNHNFYPMIRDNKDFIWLCSNNTILKIKENKILKRYDKWKYDFSFFFDIFQDSSNRIWFVTDPGTIILMDNEEFTQFPRKAIFDSATTLCIEEDDRNNIWFGSNQGLFYYNGEEFKKHPKLKELEKYSISKILKDENGRFWVGTFSGELYVIDPMKINPILKRYQYPDDLPEKNITSMLFDNSKDLWIGTHIGFFRLNLKDYKLNKSDKYLHFSGNVGMKVLACKENSIFKDKKGRIWLGTQSGAIVFQPDDIGKPFPEPKTHITGIELFLDKKNIEDYSDGFITGTNLPHKLTLPYNHNHLSVKFVGISSAPAGKVNYRWRLNPVDSDWTLPSTQEQITYTNLNSGSYRFEVKSSINNENWDVPAASFKFSVTTPFWRSNIFRYLSAFLVLGILISFYYYKSTRMKEREEDLQEKIKERSEELIIEKNKVEIINRDLEERVIQRTNELEQKNMELIQAQKLEIIGSLAGGVAHDLNNILSGVVSYPDLLLKTIDKNDPNRKYIEIIKDSGEKAAEMVQDLLTLTRKGVINKEPISINEIVKEFFNGPVFMKLRKNNPHISYSSDLTPEKTFIFGSSIHITKTIMNLIINASEAMPIDGAIEISTSRCFLDEPLKGYDRINEGDYVLLTIKDDGIGIEKKDLSNIFEPFFSKKRMGKSGTGLGMTVVLWTIKDHFGYVIVDSIKGKGTKFQLYFPAAMYDIQEEKEIPESEIITSHIGKGEHILIIEDDDNNRQLAEKILSECNFRVSSVSSGEEAVQFVEKEKVDLLILDMIMGGIDGLETYIQILMRKGEQKAVITSGYSDNENVKETIKLGAGAYIKKPYLKMQLIKAVESELRKI